MKKYLFGLLAVVFAVAAFAFTTAKSNKVDDCSSQLVYIQAITTTTDCDVAANNLIFPASGIITTRAAQPFGCRDLATQVCALGYPQSKVTEVSPGVWILNPGVSPLEYVCCVKKTANN